jgi:hypothetical protein
MIFLKGGKVVKMRYKHVIKLTLGTMKIQYTGFPEINILVRNN